MFCHNRHNIGILMNGKLLARANSVLWWSRCRIHRYVAAPLNLTKIWYYRFWEQDWYNTLVNWTLEVLRTKYSAHTAQCSEFVIPVISVAYVCSTLDNSKITTWVRFKITFENFRLTWALEGGVVGAARGGGGVRGRGSHLLRGREEAAHPT